MSVTGAGALTALVVVVVVVVGLCTFHWFLFLFCHLFFSCVLHASACGTLPQGARSLD